MARHVEWVSGWRRWLRRRAAVFGRDEAGAALEVARGAVRDVQLLVDQMPGALCRFDVQRRTMLFVSAQVEQLTGEGASEWLGERGYTRWSEAMINPTQPDWEALGRSGLPWQNQYQWRRSDGQVRWFRSVTRIVSPGVVQSLVFDATDAVETEQALVAEQRRYRTLVEQLPAVVFQNAVDGDLAYVGPQIVDVLGYTAEEFMRLANSDEWLDLVDPDDRARAAGSIAALTAGQRSDELELRMRSKHGAYRQLLIRRARVDQPDGGWYLLGVAVDITDLRSAEERGRTALAALVRATEDERARVAVELHDDTVQALTAVQIQLQRLPRDEPIRAETIDIVSGVIERTRRLMFELRPQLLERDGLAGIIAAIAHDGPWSTTTTNIDIGRQTETIEALCYRTLRELIVNARKHSNATRLRIIGAERDSQLEFVVEDDGVGFDPEAVRQRQYRLLHIGLESVTERIRLAGGRVHIVSRPDFPGTHITLSLPAEPRTQPARDDAD